MASRTSRSGLFEKADEGDFDKAGLNTVDGSQEVSEKINKRDLERNIDFFWALLAKALVGCSSTSAMFLLHWKMVPSVSFFTSTSNESEPDSRGNLDSTSN